MIVLQSLKQINTGWRHSGVAAITPARLRFPGKTLGPACSCLFLLLGLACRQSDSPSGLLKPRKQFALLTAKSVGIQGSPSEDSILVDSGKTVEFAYQSLSGYGAVSVVLDGSSVAASGRLVMDRRHVLAVGAPALLAITPTDSNVARVARAVVTSPDPVSAMDDLLRSLALVIQGLSPNDAALALQRIRAATYSAATTQNQREQVDQQLIGKVFTAPTGGAAGLLIPQRNTHGAASQFTVPISLIFSNGIGVDFSEFAEDFSYFSAGQLLGDLSAIPHPPGTPISVHAIYNQTEGLITSPNLSCIAAALRLSFTQSLDWVSQYQQFANCGGDLGAASQDIASLLAGGDASADAGRLATLISSELKLGFAVVVVGHSRGSLVAQQAIQLVTAAPQMQLDASKCVGMISIASPLWQPSALPNGLLAGTIAAGRFVPDILIQAVPGTLKAPATATDRTAIWDAAYIGLGLAAGPSVDIPLQIAGGFDIHHFSTYATSTATKSIIQSALQTIAGELQNRCTNRTPSTIKLISPDNVVAPPNATFMSPAVFEVDDVNGRPVSGATVGFAVEFGGLLQPADQVTDADGRISVVVKTGALEGPASLRAFILNNPASVVLHAFVSSARGLEVRFQFCFGSTPILFAVQDGNAPWVSIGSVDGLGQYAFTLTSSKGGVALVERKGTSGGYSTRIMYGTATELQEEGATSVCASPSVSQTITVAGLAAGELAVVNWGQSFVSANGNGAYTMAKLPVAILDMVAGGGGTLSNPVSKKYILRRDQNPATTAPIGALDFGGSEAFSPMSANVTVDNAGTDIVGAWPYYYTAGSNGPMLLQPGFVLSSGSTKPFGGVPPSRQLPGDFHGLVVQSATPGSSGLAESRTVNSFFAAVADQRVALGPKANVPTIGLTTRGANVFPFATWTGQFPYDQYFLAQFLQGNQSVVVYATSRYLGDISTVNLAAPDLTTVQGWNTSYGLNASTVIRWTTCGESADYSLKGVTPLGLCALSPPIVAGIGRTIQVGARYGSLTPPP